MRIKILAVRYDTESGGGGHKTLGLKMKYLQAQGHEVSLTTMYSGGNKIKGSTSFKIYEKFLAGSKFLELQEHVYQFLKKEEQGTDLFYLFGQSFIWGGGKYRLEGGKVPVAAYLNGYIPSMYVTPKTYQEKPILERIHRMFKDWKYAKKCLIWDSLIGKTYLNGVDRYFVASPVLKHIFEKSGVDASRMEITPSFIDLATIRKTESGTSGLKQNNFNVLYAGRINYIKGADVLVQAVAKLSHADLRLHIIGKGSQKSYLETLIRKFKLEKQVTLYDWMPQEKLYAFYKDADIFVHPCRWPEPFGRGVTEAMSLGSAVIVSEGNGATWAMGEAGLSFKNGDANDLAAKIDLLYNDRDMLRSYEKKAQERSSQFDYPVVAAAFERSLLSLTQLSHA